MSVPLRNTMYHLRALQTFTVLDNWREEFLAQCAPTQPESFPFIVMGNMCDKVKASKVSARGAQGRYLVCGKLGTSHC